MEDRLAPIALHSHMRMTEAGRLVLVMQYGLCNSMCRSRFSGREQELQLGHCMGNIVQ